MESKLQVLQMLLDTYIEMNRMKAMEPGECSHMLAHHIEFIKRQIVTMLKEVRET